MHIVLNRSAACALRRSPCGSIQAQKRRFWILAANDLLTQEEIDKYRNSSAYKAMLTMDALKAGRN
jgi:hypothetical protein